LYSRLSFLTSACLIAFGTVVVAGAVGVLPGLIERLSVGAIEVSPSCKGELRLPWGRTCSSQGDTAAVAAVDARIPGSDVKVVDQGDLGRRATVEPPQPIQNTASSETGLAEPQETVAPMPQPAPVPKLASAPPAVDEAPQAAPTAQAPPVARSVKPKPRAVKRVARREPESERRREADSERRRDEALSAVRRFGRNNTREIPVDAYAADSASRRIIVIRPTSIQDVYYYYRR
jgi:hypothetical protein